jgi:hypothetical protein
MQRTGRRTEHSSEQRTPRQRSQQGTASAPSRCNRLFRASQPPRSQGTDSAPMYPAAWCLIAPVFRVASRCPARGMLFQPGARRRGGPAGDD